MLESFYTPGRSAIISDTELSLANAVSRAMDKSAKLLRAAAADGDKEARFALGPLFLLGRGVDKNAGEAFKLFSQALDAGDEQATHFRDLAAESLALEQVKTRETDEALNLPPLPP